MLYFNFLINCSNLYKSSDLLNKLSRKTLFQIVFISFTIFLLILLTVAIVDISNKKPVYFEFDIIIIILFFLWISFCLFYSIYRYYVRTTDIDTNNDSNIFEMVDYNVPTNNHLTRFSSIDII